MFHVHCQSISTNISCQRCIIQGCGMKYMMHTRFRRTSCGCPIISHRQRNHQEKSKYQRVAELQSEGLSLITIFGGRLKARNGAESFFFFDFSFHSAFLGLDGSMIYRSIAFSIKLGYLWFPLIPSRQVAQLSSASSRFIPYP